MLRCAFACLAYSRFVKIDQLGERVDRQRRIGRGSQGRSSALLPMRRFTQTVRQVDLVSGRDIVVLALGDVEYFSLLDPVPRSLLDGCIEMRLAGLVSSPHLPP